MPYKHDLTKMTYEEFKDLLTLPLQWFDKALTQNSTLKYPTLMWDFLLKAGASQIHPHSNKSEPFIDYQDFKE